MKEIKQRSCELADIFNTHFDAYTNQYAANAAQKKAASDIMDCRTSAMGGHLELCNSCGFIQAAYHSCRNRHCPKCQTLPKQRWLEARKTELLPVKYFHMVFTLPHDINGLALCNKKTVYGILFQSVSETLKQFGENSGRRVNGEMGFISILHTWDQKLNCHIHLHCMVPSAAISPDSSQCKTGNGKYLFPVKALSIVFRAKFMERLAAAFSHNMEQADEFKAMTRNLWSKNWVVYAKPPFSGPDDVLEYIGRYTHRVAISNERIISLKEGKATFGYRNRKAGTKEVLTLDAVEFIRRFMLHVLPSGFMKIRHYGFLANRCKKDKLGIIRTLLGLSFDLPEQPQRTIMEMMLELTGKDISLCPACGQGSMMRVAIMGKISGREAIHEALAPAEVFG